MKTRIVRIGNSRGVRIPESLLELTGLSGEVEISARENTLIIQCARVPRESWKAAFQEMAQSGRRLASWTMRRRHFRAGMRTTKCCTPRYSCHHSNPKHQTIQPAANPQKPDPIARLQKLSPVGQCRRDRQRDGPRVSQERIGREILRLGNLERLQDRLAMRTSRPGGRSPCRPGRRSIPVCSRNACQV